MKHKNKIIAKQKRARRILKKRPGSSTGPSLQDKQMKAKKPLFEKITQKSLEKRIRQQTDELRVRKGQIRRGVDREKLADLKIEEQREELLHVTRVGKLAEFVSSLAHEISQPLTAILSYAQAAQRMFAGREPQLQEILQYIINDNHRATEVIRRL